jgi:hypothetical protein
VQEVREANSRHVGTDADGASILLPAFFATAGDWCRLHVLPRGLSLQWDGTYYAGQQGIDALWDECA